MAFIVLAGFSAGCAAVSVSRSVHTHSLNRGPSTATSSTARVYDETETPSGRFEAVAVLAPGHGERYATPGQSRLAFARAAAEIGADSVVGLRRTNWIVQQPIGIAARQTSAGGSFTLTKPCGFIIQVETVRHRDQPFGLPASVNIGSRIWRPVALALAERGYYPYNTDSAFLGNELPAVPGLTADFVLRTTVEDEQFVFGIIGKEFVLRLELVDAKTGRIVQTVRSSGRVVRVMLLGSASVDAMIQALCRGIARLPSPASESTRDQMAARESRSPNPDEPGN